VVRVVAASPAYECPSGCRQHQLDAASVDRLVRCEVEREAPALLAGVPAECQADIYRQLICRVVLGATVDDLVVTWRI